MIKIDKVSKRYGKSIVLDEISLHINKGEVYGLVGKNGVGKTTLLNIIAGIGCPSSGKCTVNGISIDNQTLSGKGIGYLPDLPTFYDYLTVYEYLDFLSRPAKISKADINDMIDLMGIEKKVRIKNLSRGNKQKLGIAGSIICNPSVLLLDEPTSALDPLARKEVVQLIKNLKERDTTVVISSHILSDLDKICDRVGFLNKGKIQQEVIINDTNCAKNCFIITFYEDVSADSFSTAFPFSQIDQKTIIVGSETSNDELQQELFSELQKTSLQVKEIYRKGDIDLEKVMDEVLRI